LTHPTSQPRISPPLALLFGILAVSTSSIFVRFAQQEAPSLVIAAVRLALAALILAAPALMRRRAELTTLTGRQLRLLALSGVFLALHFASWITSLELTTVASSVVLVTTTPLWVAILSPFVLHERIAPAVWVGMVVALAGGLIVGLRESCQITGFQLSCGGLFDLSTGASLQGNLLALVGAWMAAGYLTIGRQVRGSLSLVTYTFLVYGVAAVVLVMLALAAGQPLVGYSPQTVGWLVALAVIPQLLGHSTFNWALRYLPAAYVSIALLGEPIGTTILAMLFLRESPAPAEVLGGVLILAGIYLAAQRSGKS